MMEITMSSCPISLLDHATEANKGESILNKMEIGLEQ